MNTIFQINNLPKLCLTGRNKTTLNHQNLHSSIFFCLIVLFSFNVEGATVRNGIPIADGEFVVFDFTLDPNLTEGASDLHFQPEFDPTFGGPFGAPNIGSYDWAFTSFNDTAFTSDGNVFGIDGISEGIDDNGELGYWIDFDQLLPPGETLSLIVDARFIDNGVPDPEQVGDPDGFEFSFADGSLIFSPDRVNSRRFDRTEINFDPAAWQNVPVPEPSSIILLFIGLISLARNRSILRHY